VMKDQNSNGFYGKRETRDLVSEVVRVLESHGMSGERITEVVSRLGYAETARTPKGGTRMPAANGNGIGSIDSQEHGKRAHLEVPPLNPRIELSENARVILEKRYLRRNDKAEAIEDAEGLFHRVASAIAAGEKDPEVQPYWEARFYNLISSLKFLPNSPTLVNAGTGRGCLSACFVVSPDDNMNSIMEVARDAAMIEKWGGGIGFGFSKLRPRKDRIATTHGEACGPIAVMRLYSQVGATLTQGAFRLGAHMGQLLISHPDVREFIHCKDNDDTLQNFNISVQITDAFMKAVENDEDWPLVNPRDSGSGPINEVVEVVRARDLWNEICESAWKTGDPGVVFIDRVWDTQPNPQMGDIQTSNPCGEEFLENYGNCCLGSINLNKHIEGNAFNWKLLEETVRTGVRFLDDVIEVNEFPLPKLREVNLATRRIGLGIMGWADALIRLSIPYDSQEALDLADRVGRFIHDTAWDESAKLAQERGSFPEYERSALKDRGLPPVRNSSVITIAPTGTISRLADCSSGIEPHFANAWWSNVLWKDQKGSNTRLLDAPKSVWESLREQLSDEDQVREALTRIADSPNDAESIFVDYGINPAFFRTSMLIGPEAHVRMQAVWQKHVTNSVSKTINLPNEATVQDVYDAYWLAWQTDCKAVTVYRDGSKSMQVLETGHVLSGKRDTLQNQEAKQALAGAAGKDDSADGILLFPRQRPTVVRGVTERVRTGHGTMFVTVNFDDDGKPFELFTTIGKAGGSEPAHLEGLSRMISLCLRSGIDPNEIIDQLNGITSEPVWDNGVLIRSAEDGLAHVLKRHLQGIGPAAFAPRQDSAAQLGLFSSEDTDEAKASGASCPKCSGRVVHQEGCMRCLECGYTKCE
jgi:ribonucleoside-diphosphate reductase alpha chain